LRFKSVCQKYPWGADTCIQAFFCTTPNGCAYSIRLMDRIQNNSKG